MTIGQKTTTIVIGAALLLIGWDVVVAINEVPNSEDTISGILLEASKSAFVLQFAFGVLAAHLFVPRSAKFPPGISIPILSVLGLSAFAIGWFDVVEWSPLVGAVLLLTGGASGFLFWPQTEED